MDGVRYGTRRYGTAQYGGSLVDEFIAAFFRATATDHGRVFVEWSRPGGAWDRQRLLRSSVGTPLDENDGTVLRDEPVHDLVLQHEDVGLAPGRPVHYALFVRDLDQGIWHRAAVREVLVTADFGYARRLYDRLPEVFRSSDLAVVGSLPEDETQTLLYRFLSLFGLQFDHIRSELEGLRHARDPVRVPASLLPELAHLVGVAYEPVIGDRAVRRMVAAAMRIAGTRGTLSSVRELTSVFTGWQATVRLGQNLALDRLDAGPDGGLGRWTGRFNARVSYRAFADADRGPAGAGAVVATAVLPSAMSLVIDSNPVGDAPGRAQYAVPVVPRFTFHVSQYVTSELAGLTAQAGLTWLDGDGRALGETVWGEPVAVTGAWSARPVVSAYPPAEARYLEHALRVDGALAAGAEVRACGLHVQEGGRADAPWEPSRQITVYLGGETVNWVGNTSGFGLAAEGWTGATSARDEAGDYHLAFTPNLTLAENGLALVDALMLVVPDDVATGRRSYDDIRAMTDGTYQARLRRFPTYSAATLQAEALGSDALAPRFEAVYTAGRREVEAGQVWSVLVDVAGLYGDYPRTVQVGLALYDGPELIRVDWSPEQTVGRDWTTLGHELEVPPNSDYDRVAFAIRAADPVLAWRRASLQRRRLAGHRQFDGATPSPTGDYLWEGVPHRSPTHYYPQRALRAARLRELLAEVVPHPASWRLVFGAVAIPDTPRSSVGTDLDPDDRPETTVGARARLRWAATQRVEAAVTARWAVESHIVGRDLELRWVTETLHRTLAARWNTTAHARRDLTLVLASTPVGRNLTLRWDTDELTEVSDTLLVD